MGNLCFLWSSNRLFLCANAEHGEMFLPETTNGLRCDTECLLHTFHSIAKFLKIVGDEEHLHECTR